MNRIIQIVFLLLYVFVSFSQEKVHIKGIYEVSYNKKSYEECQSDTIEYRRVSLRESFRNGYIWIPWKKYKFRKYKICDLDKRMERILIDKGNDFSSIVKISEDCLDYTFIVECFSENCISIIDSLQGESFKDKIKKISKSGDFYVKNKISDDNSYKAYYIEGDALKYTYKANDLKQNLIYLQCLSPICGDMGVVDVYFLYDTQVIECIKVPDSHKWSPF